MSRKPWKGGTANPERCGHRPPRDLLKAVCSGEPRFLAMPLQHFATVASAAAEDMEGEIVL